MELYGPSSKKALSTGWLLTGVITLVNSGPIKLIIRKWARGRRVLGEQLEDLEL